jgi:repressor LexA
MLKKTTNNENSSPGNTDFFNIPLIGLVQAKNVSDNARNYDLSELVSNYPESDNKRITLKALDNAMRKAGIHEGDYINVDKNSKLKDGDIVVVKLGERIYIRKYYSERNFIRLETSENISSPLVIDRKTPGFALIGKVTSITRQL